MTALKGKPATTPQPTSNNRRFILSCSIIAIVTFVAFLPSLQNGFTNWDDDRYVSANPDIRGVSAGHIATIFTSVYLNHYLPVTMLSYMGEYSLFKSNPAAYHFTSLLLHVINALLLFGLIHALTGNYFVSMLTALLFAIHPLRVESVAWIAEMKGVLSASFFFLSLISYVRYRKSGLRAHYAACVLSLLLSLFSKSMSTSQPFVLLLLDYAMGRKIDKKALLEKVPFFVISAVFVFIAYFSVQDTMNQGPHFSFVQLLLGPAYNSCFYLIKTIFPVHLSALYNIGEQNHFLTVKMALSAVALCVMAAALYYSRHSSKIAVFSALFFIITLLPVLQIVPSGGWTTVADRYTYIPLIPVYFLFAALCSFLLKKTFQNSKAARTSLVIGVLAIVIVLSFMTYRRCGVWRNGFTLWNDVVTSSPSSVAYSNRGFAYASRHDYTRAIQDYNCAIGLNPTYAPIFNHRGNAYSAMGNVTRAIDDFNQAIALDPHYAQAFGNRGIAYKTAGNFDRAVEDFTQAIRLAPKYAMAYSNLGGAYCYKGEMDQSIEAYDQAIRLDPECAEAYYGRGLALCLKGDLKRAVEDYDRAIELNPEYAEAYNNRGVAFKDMGELHRAIESFTRAIALNPRYARAYYGRGLAYKAGGDDAHALDDIKEACALGLRSACNLFSNGPSSPGKEKK